MPWNTLPLAPTELQRLSQLARQPLANELAAFTAPDIANRLIRNTRSQSARSIQRTVFHGHGTFSTVIHEFQSVGSVEAVSGLPRGAALVLTRDPHSQDDRNSVRFEHGGNVLSWLDPETARPLALMLDEVPAPRVSASLATDPRTLMEQTDTPGLVLGDEVEISITLDST